MEKNTALKELSYAAESRRIAEERIALDVEQARETGASWAEIARELGTSKQAAQQRYGNGMEAVRAQAARNKALHEADKAETQAKYGKTESKKQEPKSPAKAATSIFIDPLESPAPCPTHGYTHRFRTCEEVTKEQGK